MLGWNVRDVSHCLIVNPSPSSDPFPKYFLAFAMPAKRQVAKSASSQPAKRRPVVRRDTQQQVSSQKQRRGPQPPYMIFVVVFFVCFAKSGFDLGLVAIIP